MAKGLIFVVALAFCSQAQAQQTAEAFIIDALNTKPVKLTSNERANVQIAQKWAKTGAKGTPMPGGGVAYTYGESLPTVVCAALHECQVRLEPGEVVRYAGVGDQRWNFEEVVSVIGEGEYQTYLMLKPQMPGLSSTLTVISDRRSYTLKLVSTTEKWMPFVQFLYPDTGTTTRIRRPVDTNAARPPVPSGPTQKNPLDLDYRYSVKVAQGSPRWLPERVFNDGIHTYVQMPAEAEHSAIPVLHVVDSKDKENIVNYRYEKNTYIVDMVFDAAVLSDGAGKKKRKTNKVIVKRVTQ